MILVLLSEKFVESPWCVLELLSAVMHKRPIAFMKISNSFKFATMKKQLVQIEFPFVEALDEFSVEIEYNETYFDAAMDKIAQRMESNEMRFPMSTESGAVVSPDDVSTQYERLRISHNRVFPEKRSFPSWGTKKVVEGETKSSGSSTVDTSSIDRAAIEKEVEEKMREKIEQEYLEKEKLKDWQSKWKDAEAQKRLREATQLAEQAVEREKQAQAKLVASEKKAAREKAKREQAKKEQARREQVAKEQAKREAIAKAAKEQEARERAAREMTKREMAKKEEAKKEKAAKEKKARDKANRFAAEAKAAGLSIGARIYMLWNNDVVVVEVTRFENDEAIICKYPDGKEYRPTTTGSISSVVDSWRKAANEKETREKLMQEKAAKEQEARERAAREQAKILQAKREQAKREQAKKEEVEKAAREKAASSGESKTHGSPVVQAAANYQRAAVARVKGSNFTLAAPSQGETKTSTIVTPPPKRTVSNIFKTIFSYFHIDFYSNSLTNLFLYFICVL
jgi:hypothetical protein